MALVDGTRPMAVRCHARSARTGKPCRAWAVRGATVCAAHGGRAPQVRAAAARRLALGEATAALAKLGRPIDVDPAEAMLEMVAEASGNVAVYRALVQSLDTRVDQAPGGIITDSDVELDEEQVESLRLLGHGIAGRVDPANWKAAEHIWVTLYNEERERLVKWAKACRDAGVDERRVQIAEAQGRRIGVVLHTAVAGLFDRLAGLVDGAVLEELQRVEMPALLRAAIETTSEERP